MQQPGTPPAGTHARPLGVAMLVILGVGSAFLSVVVVRFLGAFGGGSVTLLGLIGLAVSVLYLVFAYGAWNLKAWAWTLGVGLATASILLNLIGTVTEGQDLVGTLVNLAVSGTILYFLFHPDVKAAYGRA